MQYIIQSHTKPRMICSEDIITALGLHCYETMSALLILFHGTRGQAACLRHSVGPP